MAGHVLFEEINPNGNIQAVVVQDDRVAYFYLEGSDEIEFETRYCWIRNLVEAPDVFDANYLKPGQTPLLPKSACAHVQGAEPLEQEPLEVTWFEEGNGAALFSGGELLAVIPPVADYADFVGYARDCIEQTAICRELGPSESSEMVKRVMAARDFWESWESEGSPWDGLPERCVDAYVSQLGQYSNYFAIDGGYWPPKGMVRIPIQGAGIFLSVGMCLRPQPGVEPGKSNPFRRIELGFCMEAQTENLLPEAPGFVSAQTGVPWEFYQPLRPFQTLPCHAIPGPPGGPAFSHMLLVPRPRNSPHIKLPNFLEDGVAMLWMVPITDREKAFAEKNGGEILAQRLADAGHGWAFQYRAELSF